MNNEQQSQAMDSRSLVGNIFRLFLGSVPAWYKYCILVFLLINPLVLLTGGAYVAGWLLVLEFIFTLAMALRCYPLQPGGLLALEAVALGMTKPAMVYAEVSHNLPVLLLLMFMVAGIYFMQELLLSVFTRLLLSVKRKWLLSLLFSGVAALLSAFLDALTVTAVLITVCGGFYAVYHASISSAEIPAPDSTELDEFRAFLRSLIMHALVGTAIGGVATLVGEPQNLLIGATIGWSFMDFMHEVSPISLPVIGAGLVMAVVLEKTRAFGYGGELPDAVRGVLQQHAQATARQHDWRRPLTLIIQALAGLLLIAALALHVAEVGLVGLALLVLLTAFTGVVDERRIAHAFEAAMPFTALLVVFFAVVAVIMENDLFTPIVHWVLGFEGRMQLVLLYFANGLLSAVSDNVFVATIYISQVKEAFLAHAISREQFEAFAVAINIGTNIPSVATPNGQAAFLFLLTSALAPLIRLSYLRMAWMALPYAVILTGVGLLALVLIV